MAAVKKFHLGQDVADGLGESMDWLKRYLVRNGLSYHKGANGRPRFDDEELEAFYNHLKVSAPEPVSPLPVTGQPVMTVRGTPPRIPSSKGPRKATRQQRVAS